MSRNESVWRVAAVLAILTVGTLAPARAADHVTLCTFADCPDTRVYPLVAPAIARLDAELESVSRDLQEAEHGIELATWAAYGSGFLRHVKRGRDLDCLAVFDLGKVEGQTAADEALGRVEAVLKTFETRARRTEREPGLVPWKIEGLDDEGYLEDRTRARAVLGRAFAPDGPRVTSVLYPRLAGGLTATVMEPGEVPLPAKTSTHYLSTTVRYRPDMPPAIREVSVLLFFAVEVVQPSGAAKRWILTPTFTRMGRPIRFSENVFFAVFPRASAQQRFAALLDPQIDLLHVRLRLAARTVRAARVYCDAGAVPKALKRMHQTLDLLAPVYDPRVRCRLSCDLARWLDAPSAGDLSDLDKVAGTLAEVARRPDLYAIFEEAGAIEAVVEHWTPACRQMARGLPEHRAALDQVAAELTRIAASEGDADALAEAWCDIATRAASLATKAAPDRGALEADLTRLECPFFGAGWRFLPLLGAEGDRILVAAEHVSKERVPPSTLATLRHGGFRFEVRSTDEAPTCWLPLRVVRGNCEERTQACIRCRLAQADCCLRWRLGCARAYAR